MEFLQPKQPPRHAIRPVQEESDLLDLLTWAAGEEGLAVTVTARSGVNDVTIQMEGVEVPTLTVFLADLIGKTVVFDGYRFQVLTDEEFAAQY